MGFLIFIDSGISTDMAYGSDLPLITRNSRTLSSEAESLFPGSITGKISERSPSLSDLSNDSRASIQSLFPRIEFNSPLCPSILKGCARSQLGKVFVLNRE